MYVVRPLLYVFVGLTRLHGTSNKTNVADTNAGTFFKRIPRHGQPSNAIGRVTSVVGPSSSKRFTLGTPKGLWNPAVYVRRTRDAPLLRSATRRILRVVKTPVVEKRTLAAGPRISGDKLPRTAASRDGLRSSASRTTTEVCLVPGKLFGRIQRL